MGGYRRSRRAALLQLGAATLALRRASAGALLAVLLGCGPIIVPVHDRAVAEPAPMEPPAPELLLDVFNHSATELDVGYEFEADNVAGGGEGLIAACERHMMPFGMVAGDFEVLVDREVVLAGAVPRGAPDDGFLVVVITIEPDGTVEPVPPPRWVRAVPEFVNQPLFDCG